MGEQESITMAKVAPKTQPRPRPKQKRKPESRPTLPRHQLPAPYASLITLGEVEAPAVYAAVAARIRAQDVGAGVAQLMTMALDESYYDYLDEDSGGVNDPRSYTRLHAVRALIQLGEAAQPAIEPLLPLLNDEDDWVREEMPFFYAAVGSAAIDPLDALLLDTEGDTYARSAAGEALAEMAEQHPDLRPQILSLLEQALLNEPEDKLLRAFVIINLMDIGARESLPLIERAFAEARVDLSAVQLADVQEHFGLPITAARERILSGPDDVEDDEEDLSESDPASTALIGPESDREEAPQVPYVAPPKVGRNEPCPCGSGKKYKKCCGA